MYPYKQINYTFDSMYQRRTKVPGACEIPQGDSQRPLDLQRQPVNPRQARIHYTGYNRELTAIQVCRCAQPESHGDAFSYSESHAIGMYLGARFLDHQGQELDWNECYHRCFDILGKDFVNTKAELAVVLPQVVHPDTLRAMDAIRRKDAIWNRAGFYLVRAGEPERLSNFAST